jgi:hypothetical protein
MTKNELKEKIKVLVKQVYKPDTLSIDTSTDVTLDAPKFPVLAKFPELKDIIIDLLTDQYEIFITDIQWVAPRPTTFRIILGNGEPFLLTYTPRSWIAQVEGKKYYLLNLSEEEQAAQAIARMLAYGITEEKPGGTETPEETPEETPAETPEETPAA